MNAAPPTDAPILAETTIPGEPYGFARPLTLTVLGGLHYITGNTLPYFTLQARITHKYHPRTHIAAGPLHTEITQQFPDLADLAALHMSDLDGAPMHAEENARYWLDRSVTESPPALFDAANALRRHLRVTQVQLQAIIDQYRVAFSDLALHTTPERRDTHLRAYVRYLIESMRPRWRQEARACIIRHALQLFGDPYTPTISALDDPAGALTPPLTPARPDVTHHDHP